MSIEVSSPFLMRISGQPLVACAGTDTLSSPAAFFLTLTGIESVRSKLPRRAVAVTMVGVPSGVVRVGVPETVRVELS